MTRPRSNARRLEYVALDEITRAPRNPNGHNLPALAESIKRHGFVEPVIVDERTGFLLGGHGRLDVLTSMREEGDLPPAGISHDWGVPTIMGWASASDAEAEALLLAMVNLTKYPVEDVSLLAAMLTDLAADPGGLLGTGYDSAALDLLFSSLSADEPTDAFAAWRGMPDYQNDDRRPVAQCTVNFTSQEDAEAWSQQTFGAAFTRFVWWPQHDGFVGQTGQVEWRVDDEDEGSG